MRLEISKKELNERRRRVKERLAERGLEALCLFTPGQIFYLTGFSFIPTERPIAFLLPLEGESYLLLPRLEKEHALLCAHVDHIEAYPEYPGERHPLEYLKEIIEELKLADKRIGVDSDGYPGGYGYEGPKLTELLPQTEIQVVKKIIEEMMRIKSKEEIELIKESVKWGNLAHTLLQKYTRAGLTETEISLKASQEATLMMIHTFGERYRALSWTFTGARAGFRGQIGKYSALPHAMTRNVKIQEGDVVVTGASAEVGGYISELERTMIIGHPSKEQEKYFNLMLNAQEVAFNTLKPGIKCSEVDRKVREFFERNGLMDYWRHHTGHSLGIGIHEAPFLDIGDETIVEPGMVFSIEPGIYIPDFAGFRHSDTVLVTEEGIEILTYYPRDLKSLIIL